MSSPVQISMSPDNFAAQVANRVLALLGEPAEVPVQGTDHLPLPHIPLLPATEAALGLPADPAPHFNVSGVPRTPAYYLSRLIDYYAAVPAAQLRGALLGARAAMAFLHRFAAAHPEADWLGAILPEAGTAA